MMDHSTVCGMPGEVEGPGQVSEEELKAAQGEVARLTAGDAASSGWSRQDVAERTRWCLWAGQDSSGRKKQSALGDKAFPFEGASDARVRLADQLVNEEVGKVVTATLSQAIEVRGVDARDARFAVRMKRLLRWVTDSAIGRKRWRKEVTRLAQWALGDAPAAALMYVFWRQETALRLERLTLEGLAEMLGQAMRARRMPGNPFDLLADWMRKGEGEGAELMMAWFPHLRKGSARRVFRELRDEGVTEFPVPYVKRNHPDVAALRLFEDVWIPGETRDLESCPVVVMREWVHEAELRDRVTTAGYSEGFVDEALKHRGKSCVGAEARMPEEVTEGMGRREAADEERPEVEVLTVFYRAVSPDGVPGIWMFSFHGSVQEAATERTLLDYAHGELPFVDFTRETLTTRLLDSRGAPELARTDQGDLKLLHDSFADHTQLATLPPVRSPIRRPRGAIELQPFGLVRESRPGEVSFMDVPDYPKGNQVHQEAIRQRVDEYFGRPTETTPPRVVQVAEAMLVGAFLDSMTEVAKQALQLCQQWLTDEDLRRISGVDDGPLARSVQEIQGQFDLRLSFDPRTMDAEWLDTVLPVMAQMLAMDNQAMINRGPIIRTALTMFSPELADEALMPEKEVSQREVEDEQLNWVKMVNGVEPPMVPEGQNHELRLKVLMHLAQQNEGRVMQDPGAADKVKRRAEHLQHMVTQEKNKAIGALGAMPGGGR